MNFDNKHLWTKAIDFGLRELLFAFKKIKDGLEHFRLKSKHASQINKNLMWFFPFNH